MNIILDPWFYACAIPAVVLLGVSKSGFGVGFGALAVPLMALSISVPQAAEDTANRLLDLYASRDPALSKALQPKSELEQSQLKVSLAGNTIQAKAGSMVAYQGEVSSVSQCITDATRKQAPKDILDGFYHRDGGIPAHRA